MPRKLSVKEMAVGGYRFCRYLTRGGLFNVNLEVTKRCNARCDFCSYWRESPPEELPDYVDVLRRLQPLSLSLTGGEPLLRQDLPAVIASLRRNTAFVHLSLITNGALLTVDRGLELWEAGLDELTISLDYLDERHDQGRKIPGLTRHVLEVAPKLRKAGVNLGFNTVLKRDNFREIPGLLARTEQLGIPTSISTYNPRRVNNGEHAVRPQDLGELREVIRKVKALRSRLGTPTTGNYYLDRVPRFFEHGGVPGCTAGKNWVQVTPDGMIKRCSDHPARAHYREWRPGLFEPSACDRCWYSCRGAAQEPWTIRRFLTLAREALAG